MMDFLYGIGFLSAIHLLFIGITGKSVHRDRTIDPAENPVEFRWDVMTSTVLLALALGVALVRWLLGY